MLKSHPVRISRPFRVMPSSFRLFKASLAVSCGFGVGVVIFCLAVSYAQRLMEYTKPPIRVEFAPEISFPSYRPKGEHGA